MNMSDPLKFGQSLVGWLSIQNHNFEGIGYISRSTFSRLIKWGYLQPLQHAAGREVVLAVDDLLAAWRDRESCRTMEAMHGDRRRGNRGEAAIARWLPAVRQRRDAA